MGGNFLGPDGSRGAAEAGAGCDGAGPPPQPVGTLLKALGEGVGELGVEARKHPVFSVDERRPASLDDFGAAAAQRSAACEARAHRSRTLDEAPQAVERHLHALMTHADSQRQLAARSSPCRVSR